MEDQLEERIKNERSEKVRKLTEENRLSYMESMLGKQQRVLVERVDNKGVARGYGEHYLPVKIPTENRSRNWFADVTLEGLDQTDPGSMTGTIYKS